MFKSKNISAKCSRNIFLIKAIVLIVFCNYAFADTAPRLPMTIYGAYHTASPQSVLKNPAMIAKFDVGSVMINYNSGNYISLYTVSAGGNFTILENLNTGFALNYVNDNLITSLYSSNEHYVFSSAISWDKIILASVGINGILTNVKDEFGEDQIIPNYSVGALLEWPILKSFNIGRVKLFNHDLQFEFTPGFQYSLIGLAKETNTMKWLDYYARAELYYPESGRKIIGINVSPDMYYGGCQLDLFDIVSISSGKLIALDITEIELNVTQILSDVMSMFNIEDQTAMFKHIELRVGYGSMSDNVFFFSDFGGISHADIYYPQEIPLYSLNLKWNF